MYNIITRRKSITLLCRILDIGSQIWACCDTLKIISTAQSSVIKLIFLKLLAFQPEHSTLWSISVVWCYGAACKLSKKILPGKIHQNSNNDATQTLRIFDHLEQYDKTCWYIVIISFIYCHINYMKLNETWGLFISKCNYYTVEWEREI